MKAGVGIHPDRRAFHMFIRSGLTDDQINHIYGFVYRPNAKGPSTNLDPRKIEEAALKFYDKPWDVDRYRDCKTSLRRYSRPVTTHAATTTHRHQTSHHPRSRTSNKVSYTQSPGKKRTFRQKMATSTTTGTNPSPRGNSFQPKSWMTGKRKLTWNLSWHESLTGSTVTCWTPTLLTLTLRKSVQGGSRNVEFSAARTWFLARDCDPCHRWPLGDAGCAELQ